MNSALITKYRPQKWDDVVGHGPEIAALVDAVDNRTAHAFLLSGMPGVGKTTLMRLIGTSLGVDKPDEIAAAVFNGVDDMRGLMDGWRFVPLDSELKFVIFDEAQRITKAGFDALLKIIEEPPAHLYFGFSTTEPHKIPKSILRRCLWVRLGEVPKHELVDLLLNVAEDEQLDITKEFEGVVDVCAREARGSPGQALANLSVCIQARDRKEAADLLRAAEAETEAGDLSRALYEGAPWERLQPLLLQLKDTDADSLRYAIRAYFTKILLETKDPKKAAALLSILEPFSQPFYHTADLALAVAKVCFEQD